MSYGGGGRIRTCGTLTSTTVFKVEEGTLPNLTKCYIYTGFKDGSDYQYLPSVTISNAYKTPTSAHHVDEAGRQLG